MKYEVFQVPGDYHEHPECYANLVVFAGESVDMRGRTIPVPVVVTGQFSFGPYRISELCDPVDGSDTTKDM